MSKSIWLEASLSFKRIRIWARIWTLLPNTIEYPQYLISIPLGVLPPPSNHNTPTTLRAPALNSYCCCQDDPFVLFNFLRGLFRPPQEETTDFIMVSYFGKSCSCALFAPRAVSIGTGWEICFPPRSLWA